MCYRCRDEWDTSTPPTSIRLVNARRSAELGLHPKLDLAKACAEFYVLERLEADGSRTARAMLRELEAKLTGEFLQYLDMACGGELRHYPRGSRSCECGYGCDSDCEIMHSCADNECPNNHECSEYCHAGGAACDEDECDCLANCEEWEGCGYEGNYEGCPGCNPEQEGCTMRANYDSAGLLAELPIVAEYLDLSGGRGTDRDSAWGTWLEMRDSHDGKQALGEMVRAFMEGPWGGGFGGEAWGRAAKLAHDLVSGLISTRVFINMAWSTEHNGGCIFNKAYATHNLQHVLNLQASDKYDKLASYACPKVRALWEYRPIALRGGSDRSAEWLGRTYDVEW